MDVIVRWHCYFGRKSISEETYSYSDLSSPHPLFILDLHLESEHLFAYKTVTACLLKACMLICKSKNILPVLCPMCCRTYVTRDVYVFVPERNSHKYKVGKYIYIWKKRWNGSPEP